MGIVKGVLKTPVKLCCYGKPGLGKSSFAGLAPQSLILDLEHGVDRIDCVKTHHITRWDELYNRDESAVGILNQLCRTGEYDGYAPKTLVFDTTTALEKLLDPVATKMFNESNQKKYQNLSQIPYGQGAQQLAAMMALVMDLADVLKSKGISTIFVGHETMERVQSCEGDDFDQYTLQSMNKKVREVIIDRVDAVFYCQMEGNIVSKDKGFGVSKKVNFQTGQRIMRCNSGTGYVAKNRFNLGDTVLMTPEIYASLV